MKMLDREYATSYMSEVKWLSENGISYNFVKVIDGITIYKYTKNYRLYKELSNFYAYLESNRSLTERHIVADIEEEKWTLKKCH